MSRSGEGGRERQRDSEKESRRERQTDTETRGEIARQRQREIRSRAAGQAVGVQAARGSVGVGVGVRSERGGSRVPRGVRGGGEDPPGPSPGPGCVLSGGHCEASSRSVFPPCIASLWTISETQLLGREWKLRLVKKNLPIYLSTVKPLLLIYRSIKKPSSIAETLAYYKKGAVLNQRSTCFPFILGTAPH